MQFFRFAVLFALTAVVMPVFVLGAPSAAQAAPASRPAAKPAALPQPKRRPLYVVGRALTMANRPLSGVEISIFGSTARGDRVHFQTRTNAQGLYSQRVPDGIYGVGASLKTRYNNFNYQFALHPEDGKTGVNLDAAPGIVKNFRWKISGLKPGETAGTAGSHTEPNKYYGGALSVSSREKGFGGVVYFPAGSKLVLSLVPRAKRIDGSTGSPVFFGVSFPENSTRSLSYYASNIPVGLYTLKAALRRADGTTAPLLVKRNLDFSAPYASQVDINFEPTSFGDLQQILVTIQPPIDFDN